MPYGTKRDSAASDELLAWYDRHRRVLPWRAAPGEQPDPYRVWLSEVMLQQTTVATVTPYFRKFIDRWPTVFALAAADLDDVLQVWAGLGYYARARNLHRCARMLVDERCGLLPEEEKLLQDLPGIGTYTAAAIAAIAFDRPAVAVDGNVQRVMARLFGVKTPLPSAKPKLKRLAAQLTPCQRPGDYVQAVMDLGATLCAPSKPACPICPWSARCAAYSSGTAEELPRRIRKPRRRQRHGVAFWIERPDGAVFLRRRPPRGLLGGMVEVPSTRWGDAMPSVGDACTEAPAGVGHWSPLPGRVHHTFTHFSLELAVLRGTASSAMTGGFWCLPEALGEHALPSLTRKVAAHVLGTAGTMPKNR